MRYPIHCEKCDIYFNGYSPDAPCPSCENAAILERLEECMGYGAHGIRCISDTPWCNGDFACGTANVTCRYCMLHYIKTGRMITEEDLTDE